MSMLGSEILTESRRMLDDIAKPYKWLDAELLYYLNNSMNELARTVELFLDPSTTATTTITMVASQYDYAYSSTVLRILSATIDAGESYLTLTSAQEMTQNGQAWRDADAATPTRYMTDYKKGYITIYPKPNAAAVAAGSLVLETIRRFSIVTSGGVVTVGDFTSSNMGTNYPDMREDWHYRLIDGMLSRAYLKSGPNTYNRQKAMDHSALWKELIADIKRECLRLVSRPKNIAVHPGCI